MTEKSPEESLITTRKVVAPDLLNPNNTLFGGHLMAWIDEVAFMCARRHAGVPYVVTASIENINFIMPLKMGEHVFLSARVEYTGRTSMFIRVMVEKEDPYTGKRIMANEAFITFVALNKKHRPVMVPKLKLTSLEDRRRHYQAQIRIKVRKRFQRFIDRQMKKPLQEVDASPLTRKQEKPFIKKLSRPYYQKALLNRWKQQVGQVKAKLHLSLSR